MGVVYREVLVLMGEGLEELVEGVGRFFVERVMGFKVEVELFVDE